MMRGDWKDGARTRSVEARAEGSGVFLVTVDGAAYSLTVEPLEGGRLRLVGPGWTTLARVTAAGPRRFVSLGQMEFVFERLASRRRGAGAAGGAGLESPMPGVITRVLVSAGDTVAKGQPLVAVEAMKMEHVVRAPYAGRVRVVRVRQGENVSAGVMLLELEPQGG